MAVLTNSGRAALAASVKARPIHWAWGTGQNWWDAVRTEIKALSNGSLTTTYQNISGVVVTSQDGNNIYTLNEDYTVNASTGRITRIASGAIPSNSSILSITYTPARPDASVDQVALVTEVGRRKVTQVDFVKVDPDGEIVTTDNRWSVSETPTPNLYIRAVFDFNDAANLIIREAAIFINTAAKAGLPPGQQYFSPDQIADQGILLTLENLPPIQRSVATRQTLETVVTF